MDDQLAKALRVALDNAFFDSLAVGDGRVAALPTERARRDYMKANGRYPGPHYDATYYADPEAWRRRYEAKHPIGQDDYP